MTTETPIKIQIVKTLSTTSPSTIVAVKADGDNGFSLFVTDKTGIPYPLKDLQNNVIITNTDGNLQITSSSTSTNINLASSILATINSALQSGDNVSELTNDVGYLVQADITGKTIAKDNFEYTGSQIFITSQNFTNIYSIEVNGIALDDTQYSIVSTNQIEILDLLEFNTIPDYIIISYYI